MAAGVDARVGTDRDERIANRATYRHGHRERPWHTRLGTVPRQMPKLPRGSDVRGFLEPRRRSEQGLTTAIPEAFGHGMSTRRVAELVQSWG